MDRGYLTMDNLTLTFRMAQMDWGLFRAAEEVEIVFMDNDNKQLMRFVISREALDTLEAKYRLLSE